MRTVSVSTAKNMLSALLKEIRGGATILITDRGRPVARLVAPASPRGISASAIDLAQQGRLVLPESEPTLDWLDLPRATAKTSATEALLDERAQGR